MENFKTYELVNRNKVKVVIANYGCKVHSLWVPDRNGVLEDVVLGYDQPEQYFQGNPYFGAAIGRYANRIANGRFELDGKTYQLTVNNGSNCLHGGIRGFHDRFWKVEGQKTDTLNFSYHCPDGEEGFPGNLFVELEYHLTDENELVIQYKATTDAATVVNLTHHSFFNLAGAGKGDVLQHKYKIVADRFCPVNEKMIPTGELKDVTGSAFDLRILKSIEKSVNEKEEQLILGKGYDHNWVLNKKEGELSLAATVVEPISGRKMDVFTTEPGIQFYSGNFLDDSDDGKGGKRYPFRSGFCLEPQHFPDSPNQSTFPSTVLRPGDVYRHKTIYQFSVQE